MPTMVQSVGVSSRLNGKLASFPRHQNTSSPTPAPTASTATIGFPLGSRFLLTVCTISNLRPCNESFLIVATTVPITRASCIFFVLCALYSVLCNRLRSTKRKVPRSKHKALCSAVNIDRINHTDDRRIHRNVFHSLREARAGSGNYQHPLMKAGSYRIDCNHVSGGVAAIYVDRSNDQ